MSLVSLFLRGSKMSVCYKQFRQEVSTCQHIYIYIIFVKVSSFVGNPACIMNFYFMTRKLWKQWHFIIQILNYICYLLTNNIHIFYLLWVLDRNNNRVYSDRYTCSILKAVFCSDLNNSSLQFLCFQHWMLDKS